MLTTEEWGMFNEAMAIAKDAFANKQIIWRKSVKAIREFMDDADVEPFTDTIIEVLCNYNYMRTWPITQVTETGALDNQSIQLLIPYESFSANDLDATGQPKIKHTDFFIIDGMAHHPMGDTPVSQAQYGKDIFFTLIVKRYRGNTAPSKLTP